jgi:hypothetical protein
MVQAQNPSRRQRNKDFSGTFTYYWAIALATGEFQGASVPLIAADPGTALSSSP